LEMGGLVERQVRDALSGIDSGDSEVVARVSEQELRINQLEVSIDDDCSRVLATRAPTASDLRLLIAVLKTITDLERIGDESEKLGHIAARLNTIERPTDRYREVKHIGGVVADMVNGALDAFARLDSE